MEPLVIGNKTARIPIIQGGMGVGVSRSKLAGAVAKAGGIGIISTAQIGYDEEDFEGNETECNLRSIVKHIALAKAQANGGLVGVNVMVALKEYKEHVKTAAAAGADVIICGAGLPMDLPSLVEGYDTKIAPIVSSRRAADLILKTWDKKYHRTADFLVIEGPLAGGHLGFHEEQLANIDTLSYDNEIRSIIAGVRLYAQKYHTTIPVIVAGGIFTHEDVLHALSLGASGVQVATRFVVTEECDASDAYKKAYIDAKPSDVKIIKSPVGMPGRALYNTFIKHIEQTKDPITKCYGCIKSCHPAEIPYCITKALVNAVRGDLEHGLIFCGANVGRIHEMTTVPALIEELCGESASLCTNSQIA